MKRINERYSCKNIRFSQHANPSYVSMELEFLNQATTDQKSSSNSPYEGPGIYRSCLPGIFGTLPPKPKKHPQQTVQNGDFYVSADYAEDIMPHA